MEKFTVKIKKVDWIDKGNPEAEVLFEVNGIELWAFCHPCDFTEDEIADVCFNIVDEKIIESIFWDENKEKKKIVPAKNYRCQYYCYGQLIGIHPVKIDCGRVVFDYGDWINDERAIGSFVYFVIARLDVSRIKTPTKH